MAKQVEVEIEVEVAKAVTTKEKVTQWQADDGAVCESKEQAEEYEYWKNRLIPIAVMPCLENEFLTYQSGSYRLYWILLKDEEEQRRLNNAKFPTKFHNREGFWVYNARIPTIPPKNSRTNQ